MECATRKTDCTRDRIHSRLERCHSVASAFKRVCSARTRSCIDWFNDTHEMIEKTRCFEQFWGPFVSVALKTRLNLEYRIRIFMFFRSCFLRVSIRLPFGFYLVHLAWIWLLFGFHLAWIWFQSKIAACDSKANPIDSGDFMSMQIQFRVRISFRTQFHSECNFISNTFISNATSQWSHILNLHMQIAYKDCTVNSI